jgi:hypothetical protein
VNPIVLSIFQPESDSMLKLDQLGDTNGFLEDLACCG